MLVVKNPPASARDIRDSVPSLGREDSLEEGMANFSGILACRIPWTEEPGSHIYMNHPVDVFLPLSPMPCCC